MNVLTTGVDRPLGKSLMDRLANRFTLRGVSCHPTGGGLDAPEVDLRCADSVAPHLAGVDAVLHLSEYDPSPMVGKNSEQELLDRAARGTYVLLGEAVRAGVDRIVLASRLSLMAGYPDDYVIDEMWKPRPGASADELAPHMAEIVCREFAREGGIRAVCLRFGALDAPDGTSPDDAVCAVSAALELSFESPGYRWHVCHVSSSPRFPMRAARSLLGMGEGDAR